MQQPYRSHSVKPPPLEKIVGFQTRDAGYKVFTVALQPLLYINNDEKDMISFHPRNINNEFC
jgi:hypothetical protein